MTKYLNDAAMEAIVGGEEVIKIAALMVGVINDIDKVVYAPLPTLAIAFPTAFGNIAANVPDQTGGADEGPLANINLLLPH